MIVEEQNELFFFFHPSFSGWGIYERKLIKDKGINEIQGGGKNLNQCISLSETKEGELWDPEWRSGAF